jgi:hypothetical protein
MSQLLPAIRAWLGVLLKDLPRYLAALLRNDLAYLALCNRDQKLQAAPDGSGYRCDWRWTADLHAPRLMPWLGRWLMQRALRDHPVRMRLAPTPADVVPQVSFIIGHRGDARLPLLLKTLQSIAGQQGVAIECIVVEQDSESRLAKQLPDWVRLVHTPPPVGEMPYCRSWAFNVGAKHARGELLVLHDNDMLVPIDYAVKLLEQVRRGHDVVNLKRLIFYLSEAHTEAFFAGQASLLAQPPATVTQNLEAGGSVAITREAFERIGGMDESFIGWGGEDNEFWERAQTLKVWPYGCLPLVHLWHAAQIGKCEADSQTLKRYRALSDVSVSKRIANLRSTMFGALSGPNDVGSR